MSGRKWWCLVGAGVVLLGPGPTLLVGLVVWLFNRVAP